MCKEAPCTPARFDVAAQPNWSIRGRQVDKLRYAYGCVYQGGMQGVSKRTDYDIRQICFRCVRQLWDCLWRNAQL